MMLTQNIHMWRAFFSSSFRSHPTHKHLDLEYCIIVYAFEVASKMRDFPFRTALHSWHRASCPSVYFIRPLRKHNVRWWDEVGNMTFLMWWCSYCSYFRSPIVREKNHEPKEAMWIANKKLKKKNARQESSSAISVIFIEKVFFFSFSRFLFSVFLCVCVLLCVWDELVSWRGMGAGRRSCSFSCNCTYCVDRELVIEMMKWKSSFLFCCSIQLCMHRRRAPCIHLDIVHSQNS